MEDALRAIGQTMASVGSPDRRLDGASGGHEYRLHSLLAAWKRVDKPPERVKPVPLSVVEHIVSHATGAKGDAIGDLSQIGFFFLGRPGESTKTKSSDSLCDPFRLHDVEFHVDGKMFCAQNAPVESLVTAGSVTLVYSNQKNNVRSEGITHGLSGDPRLCPVKAVLRRVVHLRSHNAPPHTPLHCYYPSSDSPSPKYITSDHITRTIRSSTALLRPLLGIDPQTVSARSLRAGGATALLCAGVDPIITQLVGRWKSDEMLKYLHVRAVPLMQRYAHKMLLSGQFTFLPNAALPQQFLARLTPAQRLELQNLPSL